MTEVSDLEVSLMGADLAELMAAMSVLSDVQEQLMEMSDLVEQVNHAKSHIGKVMVAMCEAQGIEVPNEILDQ